jgi:glycosyltransferase involved in cell wall biosynthesis/nucleotide-binding universal stress UspA family protein
MVVATSKEYKILVPLTDVKATGDLIKVAGALMPLQAGGRLGRVVALGIVEIPEEIDFSQAVRPAQEHRQRLGKIFKIARSPDLEVGTLVRVSRQAWQGIVDAVREEDADLLLLSWKGISETPDAIFGTTIDEIMKDPPCDIALVRQHPFKQWRRILLPVRGGPHAVLALRLAVGLAERFDGVVTTLRVVPPGVASEEVERERESFNSLLAEFPKARVKQAFKVSDSVARAILEEATQHDVVVMGAAATSLPAGPHLFGPIGEVVARESEKPVVMVKTKQPLESFQPDWGTLFKEELRRSPVSISTVVDKWFAENTFDSAEWSDLGLLMRLKEKSGLTISLGLPALNEEATIGPIIQSIKSELVDRYPLLDEMVLIDSSSTDRTVEIAESHGIPVHVHQRILPQYGAVAGKGEALWKSLYLLKGDIVVWIDTDIQNIHPRFVYGLIGPLLQHQRVKYVKGFYRRPIRVGHKVLGTGGGRVTELTARPMLNLCYPELSGIVQPLAGEYAGRREALESIPFFTGYGVETGLLIDLLQAYGLQGIGQVDLKRRVHRNQSLISLSKMAFTLIQVVLRRMDSQGRLRLLAELNCSMKLIQHSKDQFRLEVKELQDRERPPMITIPEYRRIRGLR